MMMRLGCGQQRHGEELSWKWKQAQTNARVVRMESCTLTKQGQRFLTKLTTSSATNDNLIRRFVLGSPKSVVLTTLSHLLSPSTSYPHLSSIALPLYARITESPWFSWNPATVADLAALLHKLGHHQQSQILISEATSKLESRTRDLVLFYGKLLESHSKRGSQTGFDDAYCYLNGLLCTSSSVYVKRRAYEYMVSGLCTMDRPREAEDLVQDLRDSGGLQPSGFEFKSIVVVDQMQKSGLVVDTVVYNMVLSTYGIHGEHLKMVYWLQRMRSSGVPFSVRTFNSVSNCCPTIMRIVGELNELPLSIGELSARLEGGEGMVIRELLECALILEEVMVWDSLEAKLDLHGFHLGSSYLIVLLWLEEMQRRLNHSNCGVPAQITVVCGSGKHSSVRGESPVRVLVQKMMVNMGGPLKVDRKNNGCFIAKGKAVKNWLCELRKPGMND
ncbi:pentatricopeptide repeat-containing protein At2g17033 isoform X2 [Abrus precatorius]|uniref:Pentatricopeptide repeat-containing protein At2g17033 isoform X2 n=1 Tax=Abrus precatorius TaxID=3816 RepID=A0A8B8MB15_ABRPR|nr:pentatricopeptide repeat-containing protein At2g17033 isoform X2 [Abrus precatorius]